MPLSRMNDLIGDVMDEGQTDGWTEQNQDDSQTCSFTPVIGYRTENR